MAFLMASSQVIEAREGGSVRDVSQTVNVYNVYIDADVERLKQELTNTHERHWQQEYGRLRDTANTGFSEAVREPVTQLVKEVETYEAEQTPVDTDLKAKIYRLAAAVHLPHYAGGDADLCTHLLTRAQELSEGAGLIQCQVVQALLAYENDQTEGALEILNSLTSDEAVRLRFAICLETGRTNDYRQMIESGEVDPIWSRTNPDWTRAFLGYYTMEGHRREAEDAAILLLDKAPNADNYRIVAQSLTRLAHAKKNEFCQAHDLFPTFQMGLDLDELVDLKLQTQANDLFAESAARYEQHKCPQEAAKMLTAAILLSLQGGRTDDNLITWATALARLDPDNLLLIELKRPELDLSSVVGGPPTLLDLAQLLAKPTGELAYVIHIAMTVSDTPARAAEVASILESRFEQFALDGVSCAQFVFAVLQLWETAGDGERGLGWLERTASSLTHPRLKPLFYTHLHWHQDSSEAADAWLKQAIDVASNHPEVLAAAFIVHHTLGRHREKLEYARSLFQMLRTSQTAEWYLNALRGVQDFVSFLDVLNSVQDLPLEERFVRANRVHALFSLDRLLEAQSDLEWLRANDAVQPLDMHRLAWLHHLQSDPDNAILVLRECIQRFPDDVVAYLRLSQTYLMEGRHGECFEWALKARERFPDSPHVHQHLWSISFPAGEELRREARDSFHAFMPGGRFTDQSPFVPFTLEQFLEWARSTTQAEPTPELLYGTGKISRMMLCSMRNVSMFSDHQRANAVGEGRYIAHADQPQDLARLAQDRPREIVLDYSALLTLWSLFDTSILSFLAQSFDRIWLPEKLRMILLGEQERMATLGQPARHEANCTTRDGLSTRLDRITLHPRVDPEGSWDVTGHHTEITIALRDGLIHLNEYRRADDAETRAPTVGLAILADLLYETGDIDLASAQTLKEYAEPPEQEEVALKARLAEERTIVVDIFTLTTWALHHRLDPVLDYFKSIHIARPAWDRLQAEISGFEFHRKALEGIRDLRRLLSQGEKEGLLSFDTIAANRRIIRRRLNERDSAQEPEEDEPDDLQPELRLLFDYLDELLGIASREDVPIWADDHWTNNLRIGPSKPPYTFGTHSLLAFLHQHPGDAQVLDAKEYHAYYDNMVSWCYYFLPIDADHLLWHLQQGRDPKSNPVASLLRHYCTSLISYWDLSQTQDGIVKESGAELLGHYNHQLVVAMHELYRHGVSMQTSAGVLAALDVSRHAAPKILGREPQFFTSLFLHITTNEFVAEASLSAKREDFRQIVEYVHWLHNVMLESGVALEILEEAWYQLIRLPLAMLDEAQDDLNRLVARSLVGRVLDTSPTRIMQYLLSTDIGPRLREEFRLQWQEQVVFGFVDTTGDEMEVHLPAEQWQHDWEQALDRYLQAPATSVVSLGLATIKFQLMAPGSMFLVAEALPAEVHAQYPDAKGVHRSTCLLHLFAHPDISRREALWSMGLQALGFYEKPTDAWHAQKEELLQSAGDGAQLGVEMAQHLLSHRLIAQDYLAQAARLGPSSITQLLGFIEPAVVRGWLAMPSLDWSSFDDLMEWANQRVIEFAQAQQRSNLASLLEESGRSIFPDGGIVRQYAQTVLAGMPSVSEQVDVIEQLLLLAETQSSLALKANIALILSGWSHHNAAPELHRDREEMTERIAALIARTLKGFTVEDTEQEAVLILEPMICRWLYHIWMSSSQDCIPYELAYLSSVGASHITDALITHGQISYDIAQKTVETLSEDLKGRMIISGIEAQSDGFFRPACGTHLNYAASHLLHGLLADDLEHTRLRSSAEVREAALSSGARHRLEQALCSPALPDPSWLDSELEIDMAMASAAVLGTPDEEEFEAWSAEDRTRFLMAASQDAAPILAQRVVDMLPELDDEDQVMQSVIRLFQGRIQASLEWFELLQRMFVPEVLEKLRQFELCYGEAIWRLGELLLHDRAKCPAELMTLIQEFMFEIPTGENARALIRIKADVLAQLLGVGFDAVPIQQWLRKVAESERIDVPLARLAFRPFVLLWSEYPAGAREPLFGTFTEIAALPSYQNLWEFARLARHHRVLARTNVSDGEESSDHA